MVVTKRVKPRILSCRYLIVVIKTEIFSENWHLKFAIADKRNTPSKRTERELKGETTQINFATKWPFFLS